MACESARVTSPIKIKVIIVHPLIRVRWIFNLGTSFTIWIAFAIFANFANLIYLELFTGKILPKIVPNH